MMIMQHLGRTTNLGRGGRHGGGGHGGGGWHRGGGRWRGGGGYWLQPDYSWVGYCWLPVKMQDGSTAYVPAPC